MIEIKIILNKVNHFIPYDYYNRLHGYVVKLFGNSTYGMGVNRYIYTNLIGGENLKEGIKFNIEPFFIVRIDKNDSELMFNFIKNIKDNQELFFGLTVKGVSWEEKNVKEQFIFSTNKVSPILISKHYNFQRILYKDDFVNIENYLMNIIKNKAKLVNFKLDENLSFKIDSSYNHKDINYKGIKNRGRVFRFKIKANEETKRFILLNGVGKSCGCGFGFIN